NGKNEQRHTVAMSARAPVEAFLAYLLDRSLILGEDWDALPAADRSAILDCDSHADVCARLVTGGLLTEYQSTRIQNGRQYGLVLGNYRVLDRLGAGGMGVVFRAENILMRQVVAVKVMTAGMHHDDQARLRFLSETRAVAQLRHPNIVAAVDAGVVGGDSEDHPLMHYFVMEYVPGRDLESLVEQQGPMPIAQPPRPAY